MYIPQTRSDAHPRLSYTQFPLFDDSWIRWTSTKHLLHASVMATKIRGRMRVTVCSQGPQRQGQRFHTPESTLEWPMGLLKSWDIPPTSPHLLVGKTPNSPPCLFQRRPRLADKLHGHLILNSTLYNFLPVRTWGVGCNSLSPSPRVCLPEGATPAFGEGWGE